MRSFEKLAVPFDPYWYPQLAGGEYIAWIDLKISVYPSAYPIYNNTFFAKGIEVFFVEGDPPRLISPSRKLNQYHQRIYAPFGSKPTGIYVWGYAGVKVDGVVQVTTNTDAGILAQAFDAYLNDRLSERLLDYITDQSLMSALNGYATTAALSEKIGTTQFQQSIAQLSQAIDAQVNPDELSAALQALVLPTAAIDAAIAAHLAAGNQHPEYVDQSELTNQLQAAIDNLPQSVVRQSKTFEFKAIYSANSASSATYLALGISASLPQPLKSLSSKVRVRFNGYAALGSNAPRALFTLGRGNTLLHPQGTEGLAQCRGQEPAMVSCVAQDDAPGVLNPEYSLWVKLTASGVVYLNRPGTNPTPVTVSHMILEELV